MSKKNRFFLKHKISKLNNYYNDILITERPIVSPFKFRSFGITVGYPIIYREIFVFIFSGFIESITNRNRGLNQVIKLTCSISHYSFRFVAPIQLPIFLCAF